MALLTPSLLGPNSVNGPYADLISKLSAATAGNDTFKLTGADLFIINNAGGVTCTVTFSTVVANAPDNYGVVNAAHDIVLVVLAGKIGIFGPMGIKLFADGAGNCNVTYSQVASVSVGVFTVNTTS